MHRETGRRYRRLGRLPSEAAGVHDWRTREDPFEKVWEEAVEFLEGNAGLEAKTIFAHLQRTYPGRFQDGQLRTFQRRVKTWRATEGPGKEVFVESFSGEHFGRQDRCRPAGETFPNLFDNGLPGLGSQFPTAAPAVLSADFAEQ